MAFKLKWTGYERYEDGSMTFEPGETRYFKSREHIPTELLLDYRFRAESVPYEEAFPNEAGEEEEMGLGPDTYYFETQQYEPNQYIFEPEVFGPYPPGSQNDPIWYLSEEDAVSIWVFDVRVDQERSTKFVALPEDPEEELSEPVKTYFEILPSNFLSSVGARVEEIQYLVRGPDSTTIVYGPEVLDRAALAGSGGEGVVEWNGKDNDGQYVEVSEENENYRSKIPLFYHPTAETRVAVSSEPKLNGRDGNSEMVLRVGVIRINVTDGNIVDIGGLPAACQGSPPVLYRAHFGNDGGLVADQVCQGGFEIVKEGSANELRMELNVEFDAWKQRPSLGQEGMTCEVHWEMADIGEGDLVGEAVCRVESVSTASKGVHKYFIVLVSVVNRFCIFQIKTKNSAILRSFL